MTVTLKISGDDLTGRFDSELSSFNPLIVADAIGGVPWYRVTSSAATKIIGKSPLGSPTRTYFGFAFRKAGNPSSSQVFLHPFTSGGSTSFRLRLSSTGTIILDGASSNSLDTSVALANNTTYAFVGDATATTVTVTIYDASGTIVDVLMATNTFGLVDNWRMGQIGSSPALPDWYFRMLLVGDTAITASDVLATPTTLGTPRVGFLSDSNGYENGAGPTHYFSALDVPLDTRNIYYGGVGGKRIAVADLTGKTAANNIADATAWLGSIDTWVIALGTNDRPQSDSTINADIDTLLTAIGGTAKIIWIGLTSKATASTDDIRVNGLIQAKLTARGNAEFADWDTYIRGIDGGANPSPYWLTTDSTHMTPLGYEVRSAYVASLLVDAPPDITGAGDLGLPAFTLTGEGSSTVPTFTGSGALGLPPFEATGVGSTAVPVFTGAGEIGLPPLSLSGEGVTTVPVFTGAGALGLPALSVTGEGTTAVPVYTGAGSVDLPAFSVSGAGDSTIPVFTGEGSLGLPALTASGVGTVENPPGVTGSGALTLPALEASGTGTSTAPVFSGSGTLTLPAFQATGTGAVTVPSVTGAGVIVFPALVVTGTGGEGVIVIPDVRTLTPVNVDHTLTPVSFTRTLEDA